MDLQLQNKVALVTGSSRGIGLAVAWSLAREGVKVVLNGVNPETLAKSAQAMQAMGLEVTYYCGNVSRKETVNLLFNHVRERFGGLDILINNAGIYPIGLPFYELKEEQWDETLEVNLKSVFLCSQKAALLMMEQGKGGVILNASSFAGVIPSYGTSVYGATKAAILNLTRSMAAELAPFHIRVNSYMPGVVATDMTAPVREMSEDKILSQIAMHRVGLPEEVASAIVFLASPHASYITGTNLEVSGGKLAVQNPERAWLDTDKE